MTRIAQHIVCGQRNNLEDAVRAIIIEPSVPHSHERIPLVTVHDGVGGNSFGEIASYLGSYYVITSLAAFFSGVPDGPDMSAITTKTVATALTNTLNLANRTILQQAQESEQLVGMASTAVSAVIFDGILYVAWVGDSRGYLYHSGSLYQLTRDHKVVQDLIEHGLMDREEAKDHLFAHTINRYLGQPHGFAADVNCRRILPGDVILLCTDGLTDVLTDDQIAQAIESYHTGEYAFDELPNRLIDQALQTGTQDNVTVLVCEYDPAEAQKSRITRKTLTGAYPVALMTSLRNLMKETQNV